MTNEEQEASAQPPEHDPAMTDTAAVINQLNAAFLERVAETLIDLIAPDCVMEAPVRGPTATSGRGTRNASSAAGVASDPTIQFEVEHVDVDGDRAVNRWRVTHAPGLPGREPHARAGREDRRGAGVRRAALAGSVEPLAGAFRESGEHHVQWLPRT